MAEHKPSIGATSEWFTPPEYRTSPSHGENRGSSPLGSANEIKHLIQVRQLVSNNGPINVYGQAWTACRFLDWTTCVRSVWPYCWATWGRLALAEMILIELLEAAPFMWNCRMCRCDVAANAAASAGSYGQPIERAEGLRRASGVRTDIRRS